MAKKRKTKFIYQAEKDVRVLKKSLEDRLKELGGASHLTTVEVSYMHLSNLIDYMEGQRGNLEHLEKIVDYAERMWIGA